MPWQEENSNTVNWSQWDVDTEYADTITDIVCDTFSLVYRGMTGRIMRNIVITENFNLENLNHTIVSIEEDTHNSIEWEE
jgi:hypothetical protein